MKILILADKYAIEKGTGIVRYTNKLLEGLSKRIEVELIGSDPSNTLKSIINHAALMPLRILGNRNNFDLFHATAPVNALSLPLLQKPTVVTYHDATTILYKQGSKLHAKLTAPYLYKVGRYCSKVIVNSSQTKDELVRFLKFPEEKIEIVNLGVDKRFKPTKREEREYFVIGYLGALTARKRLDYLIRAFYLLIKRKPKICVKLRICGIGQEYAKLFKLVRDLNTQRDVEFKGSISDDELVNVYNSFDIFVLPSDWEGFGIPILEAQKCGVPVIIRENTHISPEVSKCCVKARSEEDMAEKMYELLVDSNLRKKIVTKGLEYSKQFTWEKTVEETLKIYEKIIQG